MLSILTRVSLLAVSVVCAASGMLASAIAATPLNVVRLLPDPLRPQIYAISANGLEVGSLLVIDSLTRNTISSIPLGKKPTDCDISEDGKTLFAINSVDQTITVIDLDSLTVTKTLTLPAYTNSGTTVTHAHVRAGKGDILYYVDGQGGPRLRVYNRATGMVLQTFGASTTGTANDDGVGGLALAPDGSAIYTWKQYGWTAGVLGTYISKFTVDASGSLTFVAKTTSARSSNFDRDPLDTPAIVTADGSRLIVKDRVFLTSDLSEVPLIYQDEIYSATRDGGITAGAGAIYSGVSGETLYSLPVSAPMQAITPDYSSMVYFNPTSKELVWLDLTATLGATALGLAIEPDDGSTVAQPSRLRWFPITGITSYQVYLGTNRGEIEAATPSSASYLGETADVWYNLPSSLVLGQKYFWRVVPVAAGGLPAGPGVTRSFVVSNLTLSRGSIDGATVEGVARHVETIDLAAATPQPWSATTDVPWITFETNTGSTPGQLVIYGNATSLAPGYHQGTVTLTTGGAPLSIPVSLRVYAANFMIAEADLELPWVYAVSQESNTSSLPSFLLRINTATDKIESAVPCGRSVTDLAIHYKENRIYLTNWQTGVLRAFDRDTFKQVRTYQFSPPGPTGYGEGGIWRVAAGKSGRLILEEADQWIDIRLINTANGAVIATVGSEYAGDGEADPTGRYYYHSGSSMSRFDLAADTFVKMTPGATGQASAVVMMGDGSKVTSGARVYNAQLGLEFTLPAEVRAGTLRGELLFTSTKAYNGSNGLELASLPVTAYVMGVTGDQKKLYQFPASTKTFRIVDLSTIAALPPRGINPTIADGSTVIGTAQSLGWSIEPFATSYRIFFGTDRDAVTNATETSPEYLGGSVTNAWTGTLPALALDGDYFWRVDTIGFAGSRKGTVWSFGVAPIDVTPRSLDLAFPGGSPIPRQSLGLASDPPISWSASTTTPWITLRASSGTTPGSLEFDLSSSGLPAGLSEGSITFQAGGDSFTVPVRLRVIALNVTKLVAHPSRPVVFGINTTAAGEGSSHLLEIDAATADILRSMPIGFSPTDADIDPINERLYISNWGYSQTRVIDLAAWNELPSLSLGEDVYKLEISPGGKLLTEGWDQWINLTIWNAATGVKIVTKSSVRAGDGEADPNGSFYYHCDSNSSGAVVTKYDISGNAFVAAANGPQIGYGSRNLVLSGDGSRLFWLGRVLNADLGAIGQLPSEVYATNRTGDLAFGSGKVWWADSATLVATLPFESTIAAVSAEDSHLLRFDPATKTLHSTPILSFTDLPGPNPRPGQVVDESPQRISWSPVTGATAYRVFIASDAAALAAMTTPVAVVTTTYYDLPEPLAFGRYYSWRVDAVTGGGMAAGSVNSFGIHFPSGPALAKIGSGSQGIAASISADHLLVGISGSAWIYQFDPASGASSPLQSVTLPGSSSEHQFGSSVAMDAGKASVGAYSFDSPASNGGAAFVYRAGDPAYWQGSGPLTLETPLSSEGFGRGMAASGNQMLVGTSYASSRMGRVAAYVTEPIAVRLQTFSANDGVSGDGFGQAIAMEGNQAIISAPGRGSSFNRLPVLYAFVRSLDTGLWTQAQTIPIAGAKSNDGSGSALALSGNYFATYNGTFDSVEIHTKDGNGNWTPSASIKQSEVPGSTSSYFGKGLALSGDLLFIGDTGATVEGINGGAVFSFRRSGTAWIAGPAITPASGTYSGFGNALAIRDGWLLAAGGSTQPAWLFRVDSASNQTPRFVGEIPSQFVSGRGFSTEIHAADADGNSDLVFDMLQGPYWMRVSAGSNGKAILDGVPAGNSGDVHTVQLRVRDGAGAQALHTFQLTLLSPADLPRFTLEPSGGNVGEGQEVVLRAAVTGIGPFKWQWYRNGEAIPGANRSTLIFGEIQIEDPTVYTVRVSNAVGGLESAAAAVNVHPANRFAGDWPTFGGSTRHSGYHPARLGRHTFIPAWSRRIHPSNALNRVAIADRRVFVSASSRFETNPTISALDLAAGDVMWTAAIPSSNSINPPSWHNGTVYFQRGKGTNDVVGPELIALDAATGTRRWASVFSAQWESYEAPAVTDDGIWINGGYYGGMYGFTPEGSRIFYLSMAQYDGWTPTVSNGRLYSWVAGQFQEHNPADGASLWLVDTGRVGGNTISAISGETAVVINSAEIVCIDLPSRSIRWRKTGSFTGSPAVAGGRAYAIQGKTVASYSLSDGSAGPVATVPETIVSEQPLLLMDHLFVASSAKTHIIDPSTSTLVNTLTGGGLLSYSNGYLLAAGTDGNLRAWYAKGALEFSPDLPETIYAGDKGSDFKLNLASHVRDIDPDESLTWSIVTQPLPAIFRSFEIDASSGVLSVVYNPYLHGAATMTLAVTDSAGNQTQTTIEFILPKHPAPKITVNSAISLNRSNGLYEQEVTVKNIAARAIWGFDLAVSGLRAGVSLHNGTTVKKNGGIVSYREPLEAGQTVSMVLTYFATPRGVIPQPVLGVGVAYPKTGARRNAGALASEVERASSTAAAALSITPAAPFAISRVNREADGSVMLEFPTELGKNYRMQYSADAIHWNACPDIIAGGGDTVRWFDRGPPSTESPPAAEPRRFYRVERLDPSIQSR